MDLISCLVYIGPQVWKLPNLLPVVTLRGHRRGVWSVEFSPIDQVFITSHYLVDYIFPPKKPPSIHLPAPPLTTQYPRRS